MNSDLFFAEENQQKEKKKFSFKILWKTLGRVFSYSIVRILTVLITVGVGLYLTLMIVNMGGYVDDIMEGQIAEILLGYGMGGYFDDMTEDERTEAIAEMQWMLEEQMGLHEPLAIRTARWWFNGVTFQWGNAERLSSLDRESILVKDVIFSRVPYTLLLVGVADVILFFSCLGIAMMLSTRRGKFWDRLLASLTPISSAPSWVHGVILLAIFALELRILPFKGLFDGAVPEDPIRYALQIGRHMILPVMAVILSVFFQGIYTWRTFFIVHSGEDYVELAKAKGLPDRMIRQRYLLRPTLPSVITSFTMMLISFWEGAIALETLFNWPGLGQLFLQAIYAFDRPVVVGIVVLFAYLLGISVILLDIAYAIIDPRVRVSGRGTATRMHSGRKNKIFRAIRHRFKKKHQPTTLSPANQFYTDTGITKRISVNKSSSLADEITKQIWVKRPNSHEGDITKPVLVKKSDFHEEEITKPVSVKRISSNEEEITKPVLVKKSSFLGDIFTQVRKQILKYPMAAVGLFIIVFLIGVAIYTVIVIPYDEAVAYWHDEGEIVTPKLARPTWTNFFRKDKWPESIVFNSQEPTKGVTFYKERVKMNDDMTDIRMSFTFNFTAAVFPQDLVIYFDSTYDEKAPFVTIILITPDGVEHNIENLKANDRVGFILSYEDIELISNDQPKAIQKLMGDPNTDLEKPETGQYTLQVLGIVFEPDADLDVRGALHGKVYGLFGTDSLRRDLTVAMLWGTPVALTYGIIGSILTTTTTILIAAISAWYGGVVDEVLQRITEVNITLPALPIAILVFMLYSKSIWVILGIMILMNIFGNSLKEYRAMFMQFKEAPYIEAAMSYGASNWRIIFIYMLPRIIQVMVPQLVISVPSFVFLEATLAYLGVAAPYLPTWGKVINMALTRGTFWGNYFWVLEPIMLVLITGLAFAFVGFAMDKILNPRLRDL
jgi:peptide/nickel transport system permease protein